MHEFAVARNLVEVAVDEAGRAGARRVTRVHCRIGPLRQLETALLREAFDAAAAETLCAGAVLEIARTPMMARCAACRHAFSVDGGGWACPCCGAPDATLTGGDELELVSLEAQVDDQEAPDEDRCPSKRL